MWVGSVARRVLVAGKFEALQAPYKKARQPAPRINRFDLGGAFKELTEHDLGLQPRQRGADTEVGSFAEGDVPLAAAAIQRSGRLHLR
jgi:hypothetical protein